MTKLSKREEAIIDAWCNCFLWILGLSFLGYILSECPSLR